MNIPQPNFSTDESLLPAIIQDDTNLKVLMLGYMNKEAFEKTLSLKKITFFSRSKNRLWTKGEESGNYLNYISHRVDCDADCILFFAKPDGPVCHTLSSTCFESKNQKEHFSLPYLESVIKERMTKTDNQKSYISDLNAKGISKIAQKVGEEATELVIEAMKDDEANFLNEAADLLFHFLILLQKKNLNLSDVIQILKNRHHQ